MEAFYDKYSDAHYFSDIWSDERSVLARLNARLLTASEANSLGVGRRLKNSEGYLKPLLNPEYQYFAFPFELDDDIYIDGGLLSKEIERQINLKLPGIKYLASTDGDKCCVVEFEKFDLSLFWAVSSPHLNTPFLVFNKECDDAFFLLDFDLPTQIVGFKPGVFSRQEVDAWNSYFSRQWPEVRRMYRHYTNLLPILEEYYSFLESLIGSEKI